MATASVVTVPPGGAQGGTLTLAVPTPPPQGPAAGGVLVGLAGDTVDGTANPAGAGAVSGTSTQAATATPVGAGDLTATGADPSMAVSIRGGAPAVGLDVASTVSVTLSGTKQPQAGDVLVIIHGNDYFALSDMQTPTVGGSSTGVTAITGGTADAGAFHAHVKSYYYVVSSTGNLTVAASETGTANEEKTLTVYVLSGVDTTTPIDVATAATSTANPTSWVMSSLTTTGTNRLLIVHANTGGGHLTTLTSPASPYTQHYNADFDGFITYTGGSEQISASGATGTRTITASPGEEFGLVGIAVTPAAGGSTVDGTATLTGAGAALATATQSAGKTLTGAGTLAGFATQSAGKSLVGAGTTAAAATQTATKTLVGAGTLTALATHATGRTLTGAGAVTAAGSEIPANVVDGTAALTGAGVLAANVTRSVAATLAGAGTVTATGQEVVGNTIDGTAALVGVGAVAAKVTASVRATLVGVGVTVAAQVRPEGPAPRSITSTRTGRRVQSTRTGRHM